MDARVDVVVMQLWACHAHGCVTVDVGVDADVDADVDAVAMQLWTWHVHSCMAAASTSASTSASSSSNLVLLRSGTIFVANMVPDLERTGSSPLKIRDHIGYEYGPGS